MKLSNKFQDFILGIGKYMIYFSGKSHWFWPLYKDENGMWMGSIGYLKIVRYVDKRANPAWRKKNGCK